MSSILGHQAILRLLERAADHPAHGYLFHGPDGVGKRLVARRFSSQLLATRYSLLDSHPDFILLKREEGKQNISVEAVRELIARMHLTSAKGGRKVALIEHAEKLNEAGMNALLKGVEEPGGDSTYIFVTEQPEHLPATLRSRLVSIALGAIPTQELRAWLQTQSSDTTLIERVVSAARGRPGIAKRLLEDPARWEAREVEVRDLLRVLSESALGCSLAFVERFAKNIAASSDPESAWKDVLSACERLLPEIVVDDPVLFSKLGNGLVLARRFVGGPLSPHLGLEWALAATYYDGEIPSFLSPSYL